MTKSGFSKKKNVEKKSSSSDNMNIKVNVNDLKLFFPPSNDSQLEKIQMTKECLYSSTPYIHSEYLRDIIGRFYDKKSLKTLKVTDATSCIGGTFMAMVNPFKKINAVELNPIHSDMMQNNIEVIFPKKHKKIKVYNKNYLSIWKKLKNNVVLIDPPWGGMDYTKNKELKLYLNDKKGNPKELMDIVKMVLTNSDIVMIKLPYNYDMQRIEMVKCKFKKKFAFIKSFMKFIPKRNPSKRLRTSYYIHVFSNLEPNKDFEDFDEYSYISDVSYKKIKYKEL